MGKSTERYETARRELLVRLLAAGAFAQVPVALAAPSLGRVPRRLPPGRSIYSLRGQVLVDGQRATEATHIDSGATVDTGPDSSVTFVVGADAFILREKSRLHLKGSAPTFITLLRVATGALLSVFGHGRKRVDTVTATVGIRGTGLYVESAPDRSYVCTCYGTTEIATIDDPAIEETIHSTHHTAPRYVLAPGSSSRIVPAPFIDHTDLELMLLENLVGRTTPFSLFDESYGRQRRY
ncbi:MAG: hypothetical protein GC151_20920 [Betaproteobacteria bacterium]|nr:hypothetical protein [Betaproteobacteria bacterium]